MKVTSYFVAGWYDFRVEYICAGISQLHCVTLGQRQLGFMDDFGNHLQLALDPIFHYFQDADYV